MELKNAFPMTSSVHIINACSAHITSRKRSNTLGKSTTNMKQKPFHSRKPRAQISSSPSLSRQAKTSLTGRPKTNVQGLTSNAGSSDRRHRASQFFPSSQSEHGFGWGLSSPDPPVRKNSHSAYPRFRAAGCKGGMSASGVGGIGGAVLRNGLHFSAPNRAHCRGCST